MLQFNFQHTENFIKKTEIKSYYEENQEKIKSALHGNGRYSDWLGWHHVENVANSCNMQRILKKAEEIKETSQAFVLIGIGGSNQGARAMLHALEPTGVEIIYAGNTLSAHEFQKIEKQLENKDFHINVIAKNFETLEPGVGFRYLRQLLRKKYGENYAERVIATGTYGSQFEEIAKKHGYTFFEFPKKIGGRFSVFSDVGLLPLAVGGVDVIELVRGAMEMENALLATENTSYENPAIHYAIYRNLLYQKGYRMEILSFFEPRLRYFAKWWIQLFAESEGKDDTAPFPVACEYSEDLHSVGQYIQEGSPIVFETFLKVTEKEMTIPLADDDVLDGFSYLQNKDIDAINKASEEGTILAHSVRLPCIEIKMPAINPFHLGQLLYFYMLLCAVSGELFGVNPFDQNGVEAYKKCMFDILGKE